MSAVTLPERWILDRYLRMLCRVLHAARAHARPSYQTVIERLTRCIESDIPDSHTADELAIESYLRAVGRTVVETRGACNELLDRDETPYKLIQSDESGGSKLVSPGCDAAMSLLDAVDNNFTNMLLCWGQDFWCRPRSLYDRLRQHEIEHESGLARFTGFLDPVDTFAPSKWACDT